MIHFDVKWVFPAKKIKKEWFKKVIEKTLKMVRKKEEIELSIAIVDESTIKKLNKKYHGVDKVTDVLSFNYQLSTNNYQLLKQIGEIVICYPQAKRQAKLYKHSTKEEIKLLLIHGLLHLCGYDHKEAKGANVMQRLEGKIIERLKNHFSGL